MAKLVSLIENTIKEGCPLHCEHGLSLFVEINDKSYLIDTGASALFLENARDLGIDLLKLDAVIISHNHYDHIGGLEALLALNNTVKVYIKREAQGEFYSKHDSVDKKISADIDIFKKYESQIIFIDKNLKIDENLHLLTNSIQNDHFFCKDSRLQEYVNGQLRPDSFSHELFIVYETPNYVSILSSCSHNGIVNIARSVQQEFRGKFIKNIIGGFHLKGLERDMSEEESLKFINETADILNDICTNKIYTCHCTGLPAFNAMKQRYPQKIEYLSTGDSVLDI